MKKFYSSTKPLLIAAALLLSFAAQSQESLVITVGDIILAPQGDTLVTAEYTDGNGNLVSDAKIGWITEPGYLGKVDRNGKLVANHPGEGYLIAKYKDLRDTVMLTVTGTPKPDDDDGMMEDEYPKIKIVPDNIRVEISDSVELRAFYIDSTGVKIDTTFEWWVEPMEVGMFSDSVPNLLYSAEAPGKGIIIARLGDLADTAKITVYETRDKKEKIQKEKDKQNNKGKQLTISPDDMMVYVGHAPIQYSATYKTNGNKHQNATYNWSVTDTTVAKIDQDGLLTLSGETGMTLVTANYSNFEASVELLVVDSTVDLEVNTISIRRVLPNGNELHPKYFKEGESYKIGGLPYPLNILNAGMLHFPFGCISEDIDIYMFIPEKYAEMNEDSTEVEFSEGVITGVKFSVVPAGSDTIVEPYWFNIPVELKLVYKQDLLDSLGIDPMNLDVFFAENTGFVSVDDEIAVVDTARNRIYASIEHFSTIVVKSADSKTTVDIIPEEKTAFDIYPNPFSTQTKIEFKLEQNTNINLSIYNLFGQEIKILANGEFQEGTHKFVWKGDKANGAKATTGIYLVRLIQDGKVNNVQRLVLNR
ncbi:T9SS C-terminal target domain-containing protein [Maribellus luteus]|uniref:T9SS C-terminal target domain-containing protein n=1 Tax=Maribellus luteus TaxID=2305463 RepID=A0A399T564_9BACT|nr:T9SS type A sorting domain-containing protein [Maribellus luteus]RIJ50084.1 T9SS C-terminal target domain-containing protein [Maribellus luteus]